MGIRSVLFAFVLLLAYSNKSNAYQDVCSDDRSIGRVLSVESTPAEFVPGHSIDITVRLKTPLKPKALWSVRHIFRAPGTHGYYDAVYSYQVPEKGTGSTRAKTEYEGSDTYTFSLHLDSWSPDLSIYLIFDLTHPCNNILVLGDLEVWNNVTGKDLPTALNIPKREVDLRGGSEAWVKIGLEVDPDDFDVSTYAYFTGEIRDGKMHSRGGIARSSDDPVRIGWLSPSGDRDRRPKIRQGKLKGTITFRKLPEKLGSTQVMTAWQTCYLHSPGDYRGNALSVTARTQILLTEFSWKPALGVSVYQYQKKLRNKEEAGEFYDTDGTRLLPVIDGPNKVKVPLVFDCKATAKNTPSIAVAAVNGDDSSFDVIRLLDPLTGDGDSGMAYNTYEVPALSVGEKMDLMCSAADGAEVTNMFFRIVKTKAVVMTTTQTSPTDLDQDTFKNGFNFTCSVEGDLSPDVKFFKQGQYNLGYEPSMEGILRMAKRNEELQNSDRFNIVTKGAEASLRISPGDNPFPWDNVAYRLLCLGTNQFTADLAYVDFQTPNQNFTNMY